MHDTNGSRSRYRWFFLLTLAAATTYQAGPTTTEAEAEQARRFKRVVSAETPAGEPLPEGLAPPLPQQSDCQDMVLRIAAAYGTPELESFLDENYPNRSELIDALARAGLRVSNVRFEIEAIESIRILPWVIVASEQRDEGIVHTIGADCIVELQKSVVFDGASGGDRTISLPSRDEWRVRLVTTVTEPRESAS